VLETKVVFRCLFDLFIVFCVCIFFYLDFHFWALAVQDNYDARVRCVREKGHFSFWDDHMRIALLACGKYPDIL